VKYTLLILCLSLLAGAAYPQACSPNFDFEKGNFDNWERSAGTVSSAGEPLLSGTVLGGDRFGLIQSTSPSARDLYGDFPTNSPNGSEYCIKLGNSLTGAQAERVSFTFDIPADKNDYSIIFNYAVVFQNPSHGQHEQPRFTSKVFDVTGNRYIECGSFDFAASSGLPGFLLSTVQSSTEVYYKPWSSVTIKLAGYQGKTIRLEFTTNDCTRGGHFGYAYIDVVNNCNSSFIGGNVFCTTLSSLTLTAPSGFAAYNWYDANFSRLLGKNSSLVLQPVPAVGTTYALEIVPYPGLGCTDTVYTTIKSAKDSFEFKVRDTLGACLPNGITLISALMPTNTTGLTYHYYTDAAETNAVIPSYSITQSGPYYIRAENKSGCTDIKPVYVHAWPMPDFAVKDPPRILSPATTDLTLSVTDPLNTYSYWINKETTQRVPDPAKVEASGIYYIKGKDLHGCEAIKPVTVTIGARMAMPSAFSPNGDRKNDVLRFIAKGGVRELAYFKIYDRWGHLVYSTNTYGEGWDGTIGGKPQDAGTYVWMAKAIDWTGVVFEQRGTVMLIR
jgi:gliding motility-associated-like protein